VFIGHWGRRSDWKRLYNGVTDLWVSFSNYPASTLAFGQEPAGDPWLLGESQARREVGFLMIRKFADPCEDLMPWVEVTDSDHHRNEGHRPANEKEEETHRSFQSYAGSTNVKVEGVEAIP
jgi:hypothetical protein